MESANGSTTRSPFQKWAPWGIIGLVAVCAGLLLPQMLPSSAPPKNSTENTSVTPPKSGPLAYKPPEWPEPPNQQGMFLRLGLGTLFVLGLCVGSIFLCKRWMGNAPQAAKSQGQLKLIETLPLGQRCWMQLVHVGTHSVLVGGDAAGMKTIVPLPESFSTLLETTDQAAPGMAAILAQRFSTNMDRTTREDEKE